MNEQNGQKVNLAGRPYLFQDADELRERLQKYFDETPISEWTVTGLALELECDRDTLLNYETNKQGQHENVSKEIIRLIKKAKMLVHNAYEKDLRNKARSGDIFALKNFGWTDKQELDHTTAGKPLILPSEVIQKNDIK